MNRLATVRFDIIRYANCWEDADLLMKALPELSGREVFCIASAGDNALALLSKGPKHVLAADLSLPQLYLTELKQVAFAYLEYSDLLCLLGVVACANRSTIYKHIRQHLSNPARRYWDERDRLIANGIIHQGKFERYFATFRKYLLPMVHNKRTIAQLFALKTAEAQNVFFDTRWNSTSWKLLMNIFFSKLVMGRLGRDKEFLKHVEVPVATYIRLKAEQHLRSVSCQENYMLHMILLGNFGDVLPYYLRPEHFQAIKTNIGCLTLAHAEAGAVVANTPFDAYCLSNIFEYVSAKEFSDISQSWASHIPRRSVLAFWNLMAMRSFSKELPEHFVADDKAHQLASVDKGFFYNRFMLERKI